MRRLSHSGGVSRRPRAAAIVNALGDLDLDYPEVDDERRQELVEARRLFDKE